MTDEMPELPDPTDLEGLHEFFQGVLGSDYKVSFPETIVDNASETMLGMVVEHVSGRLMSGDEIAQLFADKGVEIGYRGRSGMSSKAPDTIPDEVTGALDPTTLTESYGPLAPEFVDQVGRLLNLEWFESYQILANVVGHLKAMGLEEDAIQHVCSVMAHLPVAVLRSRMYLGALLEGYRRENDLDNEGVQVLVKAASQRVMNLTYGKADEEEEGVAVSKMLRDVYLGEEEYNTSWPPLGENSVHTLYEAINIAHDDD